MAVVKICGLSEPDTLEAALDAGADMVGFVFFVRSPRHVTPERARLLGRRVAGRARKVALTVDADDAELAAIVADLAPDLLQLHGDETPGRVAAVRRRFGLPVIKALGLAGTIDRVEIARFEEAADHLMFDARPPRDATRPGGNGMAFDWGLLHGLPTTKPWLLAGGLHADNVAAALTETGAWGVDVSSGVESRAGVKDRVLVARFVAQARRATERVGSAQAIG